MAATIQELEDELARVREELARKTALLDVIFTQNPDGIAIADAKANVTANPISEIIFGTVRDEVKPEDWAKVYGIFGADGVTPAPMNELPLIRALAKGETVTDDLLFIRNANRPNGTWINISAKPIPGGGAISTFRDVTDRKRLADDLAARNAELASREEERSELVGRLRAAVEELSTPVLEVWRDVLAVPIVGVLDTQRSARMSERVLEEVVARRARYVIVDVTGVEVVDTATADHLMKMALAIGLLGSECIVTGIQPAVAQALVQIGVELRGFRTFSTLKRAIEHCMRSNLARAEAST